MRSFLTILRFEAAKAARSRAAWVALLAPIALAACIAAWDQVDRRARLASGESREVITSAYASLAVGASRGLSLGAVFLLFFSSLIVSNEGAWGTLKTIALRPHSRAAWLAGKFALPAAMAVAMTLGVAAAAAIAAALAGDYTDIIEYGALASEGYPFEKAEVVRREAWAALGLAIPAMLALAAFGFMFSTMTDHTGAAAGSAFAAFVALETVKGAVGSRSAFMFNRFAPSLDDGSYFHVLRGFAEGMSDAGVAWRDDELTRCALATPAVSAAAFLLVAAIVFGRRDFAL